MNVLSLFDGISCGQLALNRAGINYDNYYASEIDKYAIEVTQYRFPKTIQLGDVCGVDVSNLEVDLLIGGTPCVGFSSLGKKLNFNDPQSKLFFEYVRILNELSLKNPNLYFLLENVIMKNEFKDRISDLVGCGPIEINSRLVSAQSRRRYYWTNIPNVTQPPDKGIKFKDILEDRPFKPMPLFLKNINRRDGIETLNWVSRDKSNCVTLKNSNSQQYLMNEDKTKTRLLTINEYERLQTLDDDYTKVGKISNDQRFKLVGNGWTVDVISHILKGLKNDS